MSSRIAVAGGMAFLWAGEEGGISERQAPLSAVHLMAAEPRFLGSGEHVGAVVRRRPRKDLCMSFCPFERDVL